ncbi:DUF1570 domain-containing protein [Paludisphaera sp.]|uniref:DUF1570 domain-containing protein n=1 Tax=Paludisphaera sp. TaxID=2017432 RepID=UPI00301D8B0A
MNRLRETTREPAARERSQRKPTAIGPFTRSVVALFAAVLAVVATARADLIYFREGGRIQIPATTEGSSIVVRLGGERYEFAPEDVEKRVPGYVPTEEWPARKAAAAGSVGRRFAAAWWALENGLVDEAAEELRAIDAVDPNHQPTRRMVAVLDDLDVPREDPDVEPFRRALGVSMAIARGPQVVLLHQHSDEEAAERLEFAGRIVTAYHLLFAGSGVPLATPRRRLILTWFADRADYRAFLMANDAQAFAPTRGYFHPTWNAVVMYDARSDDSHRAQLEALAKRREEIRMLREGLDGLPASGRMRVAVTGRRAQAVGKSDGLTLADRLGRDIRRGELLAEAGRLAYDEGITAHEMVHLLAADSGLIPRHDAFPLWLQEGLAMQFEVVRGGRWAGIGRPHDIRLPDWRRIQPSPRLEPLLRDRGFGRGYSRDPYVEAWALVHFLRARHGDGFIKYLDLLRAPRVDGEIPDSLDTFRRAFGDDLDRLEVEWLEYLATTQTPLERHDPRPRTPSETRSRD